MQTEIPTITGSNSNTSDHSEKKTVRLDMQVYVNVNMVDAAQRQMNVKFGVARSRIRAAARNFLLQEFASAVLAVNEDGTVEIGYVDEDGFGQDDEGVIDASLLFGKPSPFSDDSQG